MENPRSEPLLWVQLISLGALPLEGLLLLLLLAGADPGPLPLLERLLAWALGALAPALLLWRRPADLRSLLLVTSSSTSELLCQLARLQTDAVPRLLFVAGVMGLLPLLNWVDAAAALASRYSPLQHGGRLSGLMLAAAVLALMVWQWQQLVQATWLLTRTPAQLAAVAPLSSEELSRGRTNLGLALLQRHGLEWSAAAPNSTPPLATATAASAQGSSVEQPAEAEEPASGLSIAVEPEQGGENHDGGDLDQPIG